jgi:lysophospholipase L1-like esterase
VLVQLGLDDEFALALGEPQGTTLEEYGDNLKAIVQIIRAFNGRPILITPPIQEYFDSQGRVIPLYEVRWAVESSVAAELQTDLIDLNQLSIDLCNELGPSGSHYIFWVDHLHFTVKGAQVIAGLVVNALPDSLGTYMVGIFNQPP